MYYLLLGLLVVGGGWLVYHGAAQRRRDRVAFGFAVLVGTAGFFTLLSFWAEMLWFEAVGYSGRFWIMVAARVSTFVAGALTAGLVVGFSLRRVTRGEPRLSWVWVLAAGGGGLWGLQAWDETLLFVNAVKTGIADPILGRDTGFYLFILPFLDQLYYLLLGSVGLIAITTVRAVWLGWQRGQPIAWRAPLYVSLGLAAALATGRLLDVFHLLYSDWGVVTGPGWTDVHVRLPAYLLTAVVIALMAAAPLLPWGLRVATARRGGEDWPREAVALAAAWGGIVSFWMLALVVAPRLVQWLVVEPNEITFERPYIANNIEFTRRGFRLHEVEQRAFPAEERFTRQTARQNQDVLSEVRLWDWRALDAVFKQFQEIRLYYEFHNVDIDRYTLGDDYRQVMVSARELEQDNLPPQSQTFVNRRFKYTHGYGVAMAPVSVFTRSGLPRLLIRDIPPRAEHPALKVERPQIYYGELTTDPVVVNSEEREFDYPKGEQNAYIRYPGTGGVPISSLWRKFVFGWAFDGTRLLLSTYPTPQSRMMFHRQIAERVQTLAPFLEYDADPYIVVVDGRLKWIIDAYTTSRYYPYSEAFSAREFIEYRDGNERLAGRVAGYLGGSNYVRNAVKAVVDAFDGRVDFYVFEPDDPLIRAWWNAFPGLFKPKTAMPAALRAHVRYPEGFLLVQGLVYAKYHMEDPEVFYNQEDLWVRATEKYYGAVQPVEPYFVMWKRPGREDLEFVNILPFTPKNRQVLIGWIAGMSDGENYGRFIAYQFPKEKRVLGPQQVETKIDQDPRLSAQLTLWDQRGSRVIRGNVLAIPIDQTLLYVEPIYLKADTAAYPELRLVVLMHGDTLSYAERFEQALQALLEGTVQEPPAGAPVSGDDLAAWAVQAREAFEQYLSLQARGRFEQAAQRLRALERILRAMTQGER